MQDGVVQVVVSGIRGRRISFGDGPVVRPGLTCKRRRLEAVRDARQCNAPTQHRYLGKEL
jgi:hypothetical protein